MDLLRKASDWLEAQRTTHCTTPVQYRRAGNTRSVPATFGRTAAEVADESGLVVRSFTFDFLILAEDLGFEPRAGDVIVALDRRYEVLNLGSEGCWRYSDAYRTTYRIHTKETGPG